MKNFFKISLVIFISIIISYNCYKQTPLTLQEQYEIEDLAEIILESNGQSIIQKIFGFDFNLKSLSCFGCTFGIDVLKNFLLEKNGIEKFYSLMRTICGYTNYPYAVCEGAIAHYGDIIIDALIRKVVDGLTICTLIKVCNDTNEYESISEFAERVLLNKTIPVRNENKNNFIKTKNDIDDYIKVIQVTDIHLDTEYKEGTIANCQYPICCRELKDDDLIPVKHDIAGKYGYIGNCDANIETVKAFASKIKELNPDYLMFTGDNIAHAVWTVKQSEVVEATKISIDAIREYIGNDIPIYPAIGNHEKAPVDEFHGDESELLNGLAEIFKDSLDDEAYLTFKKYGYYSVLYKNTKLRIVSLNCLLCDSFNWNLLYDSSEVRAMFKWLENVLDNSEKNGEIVHIMDHIPMQNHQHAVDCQGRLKILMDRYQNIIKGYFSGHTHSEFLTMIHEYYNSSKVTNINYICSGLTTYSEYNPSFRMYLVDKNDYYVQDYIQYRMDLEKSNQQNTPIWNNVYNATNLFKVDSMADIDSVSKFEITPEYVQHCYTDVPGSEEKSKADWAIQSAKCRYENDNIEDLFNCTGYSTFSGSYLFYMMSKAFKKWLK